MLAGPHLPLYAGAPPPALLAKGSRSLSLGGAAPPRSGRRRCHLPLGLAAVFGLLTVSCERVPLLAPSSATITLTTTATALPLNGTTDLITQVVEQAGTPPHSGTHVTFITTLGSVQPSEAETDLNGRVVVKFLAGTVSGTATITASSGGAGSSGSTTGTTAAPDSRTVKIAIGAAAVSRIAVAANPSTLSANGGTSAIIANDLDANGNVLPGVPVTFTVDNGSLSAAVVNTDQSGNAQTVLTTNKKTVVTATAGLTASGSGTTATPGVTPATVTVNVNTVATIEVSTTPASPVVGQAVAFSIKVTPSTAGSTVQRVTIDYGDGSAVVTLGGQSTTVSHVYGSAGSYLVRATATDAIGDVSSTTTAVTIGARPQPTLTFKTVPAAPIAGQISSFTITATAATGTMIQNVAIDFGDGVRLDLGAASGDSTVQHVYAASGSYTVTATASDSNGGRASTSTVIIVTGQTVLNVNISAGAPTTGGGNTTVTFTAAVLPAGASINGFAWNFGDGSTASTTGTQVTHTYSPPSGTGSGVKTVTVTATSNTGQTGSSSMSFVP